jgi:site-specific DNA-methyltransferase (adenine-specific)
MTVRILQGDCVEVMRTLAENSVDSIVTDPPYGIRFMGKAWDGADIEARAQARRDCPSKFDGTGPNGGHNSIAAEAGKYAKSLSAMRAFQEFSEEWAREALRVLKPGGYLLSLSSPRTYHRMVSGIEDAGFEIRDQILWIFGSGFPKSHNGEWGGTALKPAHEPIVVSRKPLDGTVEENWRKWGTGALNIDGCRIETSDEDPNRRDNPSADASRDGATYNLGKTERAPTLQQGRWPSNVIHDGSDEVLAAFPGAPGQMADASASASARKTQNVYGAMRRGRGDEASADSKNAGAVGFSMRPGTRRLDAGSAARFFYCAKASKRDRNEGLEGLEGQRVGDGRKVHSDNAYQRGKTERLNTHPTVKPTDLMRYLIRLVTPAGGTLLDCFMGSGSTLKAAVLEGFDAIGIELDDEHIATAQRRVDHAFRQAEEEAAAQAEEVALPVTLDLFAEVTA